MSSKPPRFTTAPPACSGPPECAIRMWAQLHDPSSIEGEKWVRADERRLIAGLVKLNMKTEHLQELANSERRHLAQLAQLIMTAIAEREAA